MKFMNTRTVKTIGFTYDLKDDYLAEGYSKEEAAEFDLPETIDSIEECIKNMGFEVEKIGNIKNLTKLLAKGKRWDLVFNIAEGAHGTARETQIPSLLDAYCIPYVFSDACLITAGLNKDLTKLLVRQIGIPTPDFIVVKKMEDLSRVQMPFPLFVKPLAEGTSKGISEDSVIHNREQLNKRINYLLSAFNQPVLVEKYLPGREFTVGIVGNGNDAHCVGVLEISLNNKAEKGVYSLANKANYEERVTYSIANDSTALKCEQFALKIWEELGFKDAGRFDFRLDEDGEPNFIEVNPLAGLNPVHSDLPIMCGLNGISFQQLIEQIVNSAIVRITGKN